MKKIFGRITSMITRIFRWVWKTIRRVINMFRRKRRPIEPTVVYNVITDAVKTAPVVKVDEFFREPEVELEEDHNADTIVITD